MLGRSANGALRRVATRAWRDPRLAPAVALVSTVTYLAVRAGAFHATSYDLVVYRAEGHQILFGHDLYGRLPVPDGALATYPPFAAMLFVLFALVPVAVAKLAMLAGNVLAVYVASVLTVHLAARRPARTPALRGGMLLGAVVLWSEPVSTTLRFGQINLVLLCLVLADVVALDRSRFAGIRTGIAAAIKVTPLVFVAYLVLTRRWRAAAVAASSFAGTVLLSALVLPSATARFWTVLLFRSSRVGSLDNPLNQTLRGIGARLPHGASGAVTTLTVALVVVGALACVAARRRLGELWAVSVAAVTALAASPIAWSHHWVWCVPVTAVLWFRARRWIWVAVPFWTYAVWLVPHGHTAAAHHLGRGYVLLSALYPLTAAAFLAVTVVECLARRSRPGPRRTVGRHADLPAAIGAPT